MSNQLRELVIFDVETTGIDPRDGHEIVEIGAERLVGDNVTGQFEALIKPTRPIEPEASEVSGITNELLDLQGRPAKEVIPEFLEFAGNRVLVGHNVQFDTGFVNTHLEKLGIPLLSNDYLDTLVMAKKLLILPSYSLERVAAYLKIPQPLTHRAKADVETTRHVFLKLLERQQAGG